MPAIDPLNRTFVTTRLIVGLAIALFGVVLVLDRFHLAVATEVLRLWPAVIIAVGLVVMFQTRQVGSGINGLIIMAVGGWLLMNSLGIVRVRFWELFWPMMLILIGTALVLQALGRRRDGSPEDTDDTITMFAVLGGVKRISRSTRFRGGEITLFMGGGQIDLREAMIPRGEEAVINVFAVIGGCEILVPPSWTVAVPLVPVMGGVEDKRPSPLPEGVTAAAGNVAAPRLVLRGFTMMSGIQIKS